MAPAKRATAFETRQWKREPIDTGQTGTIRQAHGQWSFAESDDVGKSLAVD
jgi:hypothetical protein